MDEEKTKGKEKEETASGSEQKGAGDSDAGDKYETTPVIERAREEREKLEAATKAQKEENDRTEAIMAKRALGGMTEAGTPAEKPKEDDPLEYRNKIMSGELNKKEE